MNIQMWVDTRDAANPDAYIFALQKAVQERWTRCNVHIHSAYYNGVRADVATVEDEILDIIIPGVDKDVDWPEED